MLRSRGIASRSIGRHRYNLVGAHPCRVLVSAFRRNELLLGFINMRTLQTKRLRQHARRVRSPESIPTNSGERPLIGPYHSKINFFQALRLRGEIEIFSHCGGSRMPNAQKKTGISCCIEQRSR
jgi:hypothetical protein